jgi:hypothetical protein
MATFSLPHISQLSCITYWLLRAIFLAEVPFHRSHVLSPSFLLQLIHVRLIFWLTFPV